MSKNAPSRAATQAWESAMEKGKQHFRQGRMRDAILAFSQATELLPYRLEGWINMGSALLEHKEYDTATAVLTRAIHIDPKVMVAHMLLGDTLRMRGQKKNALTSYERAVALQRSPLSLNKLGCALRGKKRDEEAQQLYLEAIRMEPTFSLAQVNLATLQIERQRYTEAGEQLGKLATQRLPPTEHREVVSAQVALAEYHRLANVIDDMCATGGLHALNHALQQTPANIVRADAKAMKTVDQYALAAGDIPAQALPLSVQLPTDWPLIEAMFMIPQITTVNDYHDTKAKLDTGMTPDGDLLESANMAPAIAAARACRETMSDPVQAEVNLRHWHKLACQNVPGFLPGHFKYTQNWSAKGPNLPRVDPALTSGTMRHVISQLYSALAPGLPRAIVGFLAVSDLHPFADGNGRVAITWLNRELEWAGLMPALFSRELGLQGKLGDAVKQVRSDCGDLTSLIAAIVHGQEHALAFCEEIATS